MFDSSNIVKTLGVWIGISVIVNAFIAWIDTTIFLNTLSASATIVAGVSIYWVKQRSERRFMRQNMARILHSELYTNQILIIEASRSQATRVPVVDDVYRGLLASGNIHHLHIHQHKLHTLYSQMSTKASRAAGVPDLLNQMLKEIGAIACH